LLARLWREMIAANLWLQEPFSVAICSRPDRPGLWDLARDHYGVACQLQEMTSSAQVVRAVAEGEALIGVVPGPVQDDTDPWWPSLTASGGDKGQPRVIARLPFVAAGNARGERPEALSIARLDPEPTGNDRSLLAVETTSPISRARLADALRQAGLAPRAAGLGHDPGARRRTPEPVRGRRLRVAAGPGAGQTDRGRADGHRGRLHRPRAGDRRLRHAGRPELDLPFAARIASMAPTPRPGILDIAAYVPGSHSIPGVEIKAVLSANESPLGAEPAAMAAFRATMPRQLHRYPDGSVDGAARGDRPRQYGLAPERLIVLRQWLGRGAEPDRCTPMPARATRCVYSASTASWCTRSPPRARRRPR
jgi:hypothetical protein